MNHLLTIFPALSVGAPAVQYELGVTKIALVT